MVELSIQIIYKLKYFAELIWFVTYQSYVSGKIDQLGTQAKAE